MKPKKDDELPIFIRWMEFLEWLLTATAKFPRHVRQTFSHRIEDLALAVAEDLVEARYSADKLELLRRVNLKLEKMRVLLRLSHRLKHLSHDGYEHAARSINEVGRQLGAWIKEREAR
ncbi:MAG: diversity-generating retroelement protein Avd [Blastocatellia bacterium]